MADYQIVDNHIELAKLPKKFKKLTGTRFATVMGLNAWASPFETWCAITRTYEEPFEDSIYTIAGKVIEPKIIDYLRKRYFLDIKTPEDVYGPDHFRKTWGDFYPNEPVMGGMWDGLGDDFIVEIKTTKRAEDWQDGIPIYYKLQACLYAYLLGFDDVVMTASFLEAGDYERPELFEPNVTNTVVYDFKISVDYPNFEADFIQPALTFWQDHVLTGISPDFDEKKDAKILKVLRTNTVAPTDADMKKLLVEADRLKTSLEKAEEKLKEKRDRLKEIEGRMKDFMAGQYRDGDKKVEVASKNYNWTLTRSVRNSFDSKAFQADKPDLASHYMKQTEAFTLKASQLSTD